VDEGQGAKARLHQGREEEEVVRTALVEEEEKYIVASVGVAINERPRPWELPDCGPAVG
jgi:hypothetical protein